MKFLLPSKQKMRIKTILTEFCIIALIVFVVGSIVGFLYEWIAIGKGSFDWVSSLRLALIFGIALPLINARDRWKKTGKN